MQSQTNDNLNTNENNSDFHEYVRESEDSNAAYKGEYKEQLASDDNLEKNSQIVIDTSIDEKKDSDKRNSAPIYVAFILILSIICGILGGMVFSEKNKNQKLISKVNEQSKQIYEYKFGTLP